MSTARNENAYLGSAYPFNVIRERMRRHSGRVLDFAIGRRHEPPPAWLADTLGENAERSLIRCPREETDRFVQAALSMLSSVFGVSLSKDSILPAPSGRAALSALAATLVGPGDGVLVTEPGYPAFPRLAAQRHARIHAVRLDPDRDFEPVLDVLQGASIGLAGLNYPNNPTGAVISGETLDAVRERLTPGAVVFNDAIYGPLTYGRPPFSLLAQEYAPEDGPGILELYSLGKLYALGPLGVAFLAGDEELVARIRQYSEFSWTQLSSLQVRVATRCLEDWQHVERVREGTRRRIESLVAVLGTLGFEPFPVGAGLYVLCRLPAKLAGRAVSSAGEAAERLLDEYGLAVMPFEVPPHGYLRFSAAHLPDELDALAGLADGSGLASR